MNVFNFVYSFIFELLCVWYKMCVLFP